MLTDFHENISNIIKEYIEKKNELHLKRQSMSDLDIALKNLEGCKFSSFDDMNRDL